MDQTDQIDEASDLELDRLFTLVDLDKLFFDTPDAKIVNNSTLVCRKFSREVTDAIFSNSSGDLEFVPTCQCGETKGVSKQGLVCPVCGTVCSSQFIDSLSHNSWLGIPPNYSPVLHPIWFFILKRWTSYGKQSKLSVINIILDPSEEIPDDLYPFIKNQGFQYFYDNVDYVMDVLLTKYSKTVKKKAMTKNVATFYKHYKHVMFTRHLPVLHSSLHPLRCNGGTLKYTDNISKDIVAAIVDLNIITFRSHAIRTSQRQMDKSLYGIYIKVMKYYELLIKNKLGNKQALLRKHGFGSRVHFSARSVVTPHDRILPFDEVVLPWKMIVNSLKLQILNHLIHRHGYLLEDAVCKFMEALVQYDEDIDKIIQTILAEFPGGRMPIALGRNPTLSYGSIMKLYVREFRKNPKDETLSINACIVKPANIDFDGDELYHFDILTTNLADSLANIHPSQMLFDIASPGLSSRIGLLQQNHVTLEAFLEDDEEDSSFYKEIS